MARRRRGQFPLPKKERGQWRIRYYTDEAQSDGSIRRVRKTKCLGKVEAMTYREARKETQRFLQAINDVEPGIEHAGRTVNDLIDQWREAVKPTLKRSTQESYEWAFKRIVKRFGATPVSAIERADVQQFLTAACRNLAPESIYDLRNRLSGLLTSAEEWQWIRPGAHPVRGRLRLPEKVSARQKRILEPEQLDLLLMALTEPYRTIVLVAAFTGLRKGEIAALRWNDVGLGYINVDENLYRGELGTPKTRRSKRRVSIGPRLQRALADWRAQARFVGDEDFVFSLKTNSPIDLHNAKARHIKPACIKLGLPLMSWHDFRHTYTTWGRRAGVKAETMRDQLGHHSVQLTLDLYSHVDDRAAEAAHIEDYASLMEPLNGTPGRFARSGKSVSDSKQMVGGPRLELGTSCL